MKTLKELKKEVYDKAMEYNPCDTVDSVKKCRTKKEMDYKLIEQS